MASIPPHPNYIGPCDAEYDVAASISYPDSMWIVQPQLYFSCTLRSLNAAVNCYYNFFRAFEDLLLCITGTMESKAGRSFTSPLLFLLAELRIFSVGFHTFHASWMATQLQLFLTNKQLDRVRTLHSALLMDLSRDCSEAAM